MENIADKKRAILESTLELIKENGFHGTPMSLVAKKACVAAGTIYHYFDSKETLIIELHSYVLNTLVAAITRGDDPEKPYKDRLTSIWMNHYHYYLSHPEVHQFLEQYTNSPYYTKYFDEMRCIPNTLKTFLSDGIAKGILKPAPERLIGEMMHSSVSSVAKLSLSKRLEIDETVLNQAMEIVWDGIKAHN